MIYLESLSNWNRKFELIRVKLWSFSLLKGTINLSSFMYVMVFVQVSQATDSMLQIDLKRAYNVEIMLTKVKMPLPDMMVS